MAASEEAYGAGHEATFDKERSYPERSRTVRSELSEEAFPELIGTSHGGIVTVHTGVKFDPSDEPPA